MARQENEIGIDPELVEFRERYLKAVRDYLKEVPYGVLSPLDPYTIISTDDDKLLSDSPEQPTPEQIKIIGEILYRELHIDSTEIIDPYSFELPEGTSLTGTVQVKQYEVKEKDEFEGWTLQEHLYPDGSIEYLIGERGIIWEGPSSDVFLSEELNNSK